MFAERYIPQKRQLIVKDSSIKRIIFNDKQKCLTCPRSIRLINGKLVKFPTMQDKGKKYEHTETCPQRDRF